jgi:hypothetical protein
VAVELRNVWIFERVLIFRAGHLVVYRQVLHGLQVKMNARNAVQAALQT